MSPSLPVAGDAFDPHRLRRAHLNSRFRILSEMTGTIPVVDLFSGPGGLAEGFAEVRDSSGRRRFRIALSVEMESTAYRTLRLRTFLRKFPGELPSEYYDFLNREVAEEPDWAALYPDKWQEACDETQCLTLGTSDASAVVQERIQGLRKDHGNRTVLLGGPPCQSYSVAGRSRNAGIADYDADKDPLQFLYREYVEVLARLQPAIAVMENVKGMLSARLEGRPIFSKVMESLCNAGGEDRYRLFGLATPRRGQCWRQGLQPKDFLVRSEEHGVPQTRHRVFVICVRDDVASEILEHALPQLEKSEVTVSVNDLIGTMPKLRSRLSRNDFDASWKRTVQDAYELLQVIQPAMKQKQKKIFDEALKRASEMLQGPILPFRDSLGGLSIADSCPIELSDWIIDENLTALPNNETRGHMDGDLRRYLFAAAFACAFERSPKASDFPPTFAPRHANWGTGKFRDRFRVQLRDRPSTTITSHISKDGHYYIHPDPAQCRSLTVREAARLQTFPDNYFFHGGRTQQYVQVGNAVPPYLAWQIAERVWDVFDHHDRTRTANRERSSTDESHEPATGQNSTSIQTARAS